MTARKKKRPRPPRVVLLDTRHLVQLDDLAARLVEAIGRLADLADLVTTLSQAARQMLPIVSEMHAAAEVRRAAGRKAARTRQQQQAEAEVASAVLPLSPEESQR